MCTSPHDEEVNISYVYVEEDDRIYINLNSNINDDCSQFSTVTVATTSDARGTCWLYSIVYSQQLLSHH